VSADNVDVAVVLVREQLKNLNLDQAIFASQLIPMVTSSRKCRILSDGGVQEEPVTQEEESADPEDVVSNQDLICALLDAERKNGFLLGSMEAISEIGIDLEPSQCAGFVLKKYRELFVE
jgi:hypothetical protein